MAKGCGVICEYNPFHNGHAHQIRVIRDTLGLPTVCAMSGSFVQRAEAACMDKYTRAANAVKGGASVVLEIPFPYCCMSAEKFAEAGVRVLAGSGMCSHIAFGAEDPDLTLLGNIADCLLSDAFRKESAALRADAPELSYAVIRERAAASLLGKEAADALRRPNNILAVEYLKAIRKCGAPLIPAALPRSVSREEGVRLCEASSAHIRKLAREGRIAEAAAYMPCGAENVRDIHGAFETFIFPALAVKERTAYEHILECGAGLDGRLYKAVRAAKSTADAAEKLRCKTLTDAKIRRMLLFAFFGVTDARAEKNVSYTEILADAGDDTARALLRAARKDKRIAVCRDAAQIRKDKETALDASLAARADTVFAYAASFAAYPTERMEKT